MAATSPFLLPLRSPVHLLRGASTWLQQREGSALASAMSGGKAPPATTASASMRLTASPVRHCQLLQNFCRS